MQRLKWALVGLVMSCATIASADPALTIGIEGHSFVPATATIKVGDTVLWKNNSVFTHTVTDDATLAQLAAHAALPDGAEAWDSGRLAPNATFEHTFTVAGTYRYFCRPHELMGHVAELIVLPATTP